MGTFRYTDCGLDNVIIEGINSITDDAGNDTITIPNINELHRAIALGVIEKRTGLSGRELRYLRTEIGKTQAELAEVIHAAPLTVSRWERGECPIDPNAEAILRIHAAEVLNLQPSANATQISSWCVPSANPKPIVIDGSNPDNYQPKLAA